VVRFRALGLQPSGTIHLQDPCPLGPQEAGKPCTEGAGAFYPYAIQGEGEVEILMGIHAQSERCNGPKVAWTRPGPLRLAGGTRRGRRPVSAPAFEPVAFA
jgi:hypothetical protein